MLSKEDIVTISHAMMDGEVSTAIYQGGIPSLKDNQIVIEIDGDSRHFKITIEEYNF